MDEDGIIETVYIAAANEHDSKGLIRLLEELLQAKKKEVWPAKG